MRDIKLSVFLCMHLYIESVFVKKKKKSQQNLGTVVYMYIHLHSVGYIKPILMGNWCKHPINNPSPSQSYDTRTHFEINRQNFIS